MRQAVQPLETVSMLAVALHLPSLAARNQKGILSTRTDPMRDNKPDKGNFQLCFLCYTAESGIAPEP
jgi:hypothetical protein